MVALIISLVTGAVGGNVAGAVLKKFSMGTLWNSVAGILGGGLGGALLSMLGIEAGPSGALDLEAIIGSVASGGAGGGTALAIIGMLRNAFGKASAS